MKRVVRKWFRNENLRNLTTNISKRHPNFDVSAVSHLWHTSSRKARAWQKFFTRLIWWSIGAHPLPLPPVPSHPYQHRPSHAQPWFILKIFQVSYQPRQGSMLLYLLLFQFLFLCFRALRKLLEWFEICSASPTPIIGRYLGSLIWNCYSSSRINLQTIWNCTIWWIWLRFKILVKYFFWGWMYLCPRDFWKIFWFFFQQNEPHLCQNATFLFKKLVFWNDLLRHWLEHPSLQDLFYDLYGAFSNLDHLRLFHSLLCSFVHWISYIYIYIYSKTTDHKYHQFPLYLSLWVSQKNVAGNWKWAI